MEAGSNIKRPAERVALSAREFSAFAAPYWKLPTVPGERTLRAAGSVSSRRAGDEVFRDVDCIALATAQRRRITKHNVLNGWSDRIVRCERASGTRER